MRARAQGRVNRSPPDGRNDQIHVPAADGQVGLSARNQASPGDGCGDAAGRAGDGSTRHLDHSVGAQAQRRRGRVVDGDGVSTKRQRAGGDIKDGWVLSPVKVAGVEVKEIGCDPRLTTPLGAESLMVAALFSGTAPVPPALRVVLLLKV